MVPKVKKKEKKLIAPNDERLIIRHLFSPYQNRMSIIELVAYVGRIQS